MEATPGGCAQNIFLKGWLPQNGEIFKAGLGTFKETMNSNTEAEWVNPTTKTLFTTFPTSLDYNCVRLFKNGPSKICGRKPLKNLK